MKDGIDVDSAETMPLLPLFMRAAVLKQLVENSNADAKVTILRQLVALFLDHGIAQKAFTDGTKKMILALFDVDQVLICIDGLDEAAELQELVEGAVEHAIKEARNQNRRLHVLLSTREHSYVHSRACLRLGDFSVVNLQPLNDDRRLEMLRGRLPTEKIVIFQEQLAEIARKNPELAGSPFLLSLMIEVYKKDGEIPKQRVELYAKQVEAIVSRCIANRMDGELDVDEAAHVEITHFKNDETRAAEKRQEKLATRYLETLAYVCQLQRKERDFTLAACQGHMHELWGADQLESFSESEKNLFKGPIVGLLTGVGQTLEGVEAYRFSHLTLQEYLAARCAVRLCGYNVRQLVLTLHPLHSRWKREVLQFAACLIQLETVYVAFCRAVLESDDGTGACCEMVKDFSQERGKSAEVDQMVRDKFDKIRGTPSLVAGLCHPSLELRNCILSEMDSFGMPPDPFSETDGIVAELKKIAEDKDRDAEWYTRAAAILSLMQIAQMQRCQQGGGRLQTLRWVLTMLATNIDENVYDALVKGLGTLLKGGEDVMKDETCITIRTEDEQALLHALENLAGHSWNSAALMDVVADLSISSDGLTDWVLNKCCRIADGSWPMRHVLHVICKNIVTSVDHRRALLLAEQLFVRLHAVSKKVHEIEASHLSDCLKAMFKIIGTDKLQLLLPLLKFGEVMQRARVIKIAACLQMNFAQESLHELAHCLLSDMDAVADSTGQSVLKELMQHELEEHKANLLMHSTLFQTSKVLCFLLDIFKSLCGDPQEVVMQLTLFDRQSHYHTREKDNPDVPASEQEQHNGMAKIEDIQRISLKTLSYEVKYFTPQMLKIPKRKANSFDLVVPLEIYCAARLWADTGLIQLDSATSMNPEKYIAECFALSDAQSARYEDAFSVITKPWKYEYNEQENCRWDQAVSELMQDRMLGQIFFKHVLLVIRERQGAMAGDQMKTIKTDIQQWQTSDATEQLEKQFLLKELWIGKRSQPFPTWTGLVSAQTGYVGCGELTAFLADNGFLPHDAFKISNIMQLSVKHFLLLKRGDIDLDDVHFSCLKRQHKTLLLAIIDSNADHGSDGDSGAADHGSDSDSGTSLYYT